MKVKGRKRQALVDTGRRALILDPRPADVQERDGAVPVLCQSGRSSPFVSKAIADAGYSGDMPATATIVIIIIEIVKKPPDQVDFTGHPRHLVVERFVAWISRNRRLCKDPVATLASAKAFPMP